MLPPLISHNPDLSRLAQAGFEVSIQSNHLVVDHVPYVNSECNVVYGKLVSTLEINANTTLSPKQHIVYFVGDHPCNSEGEKLECIAHSSSNKTLGNGLVVNHSFSNKPKDGYKDYFEKMTLYEDIISRHARVIDPRVTSKTYAVKESDDEDSVFKYPDSASTRSGIAALTNKLALGKVGIIGLGGTGSYVLDLIAKTPIKEIHLFDGDTFLQHNAFRFPGAATFEQLGKRTPKVHYLRRKYSHMRKNIVAHPIYLDEENLGLLEHMDFVFLCIDSNSAKSPIVEYLENTNIAFVDTGMGVHINDGKLLGLVSVTASTNGKRDHFRKRVGFEDAVEDQAYSTNVQIAELNALNAALAVIKWKKLMGFYVDYEEEHFCTYIIDGNLISNKDYS